MNMAKPYFLSGLSALVFSIILALSRPASADTALVIGINKYPHLDKANLDGCVNDANSMKKTFEGRAFHVIELTDAQATREGILAMLRELKRQV